MKKDTQWQKGAAEQLIRAFKDALDLTMLNDAGYLDLYESRTLSIEHAQSKQVGQEVLIEGGVKYTWFSRCFPSLFAFRGWVKKVRNLEVGDIVLVETKLKMGKGSYRMARVIETYPDDNGLVRKVTLEARPEGGPLGLLYVPKDLEKFNMAVQ